MSESAPEHESVLRTMDVTVGKLKLRVTEPSALEMLDYRSRREESLEDACAFLFRRCFVNLLTGKPAFTAEEAAKHAHDDGRMSIPLVNAVFGFPRKPVIEGIDGEKKDLNSPTKSVSSGASPPDSATPAASSSH